MSIDAFKSELFKRAIGPGATWQIADFHVHAPSSSDYEYRATDAVEKLGRELSAGKYTFAVILKHQEFPSREELSALQSYCPQTKLIPGAEINVLVDALSKKIGKDYFFHCIVAVDPDSLGDYGYVLRKAQEKFTYRFGDYPAGFRSSIIDLGKFFREEGALFIPAHLHQAKEPSTSRSIDDLYEDEAFLGFIRDGAFNALEVRERSTAEFFDGNKVTQDKLSIPAAICVAYSDAHHHDHIAARDRNTWVRVEKKSFSELSAALSFRHRVSLTSHRNAYPRIIGLHVVGAFIPECWVVFNEGLNALIWKQGFWEDCFARMSTICA